jgi:hypothetical protein
MLTRRAYQAVHNLTRTVVELLANPYGALTFGSDNRVCARVYQAAAAGLFWTGSCTSSGRVDRRGFDG